MHIQCILWKAYCYYKKALNNTQLTNDNKWQDFEVTAQKKIHNQSWFKNDANHLITNNQKISIKKRPVSDCYC